jgi:hypothetical protein
MRLQLRAAITHFFPITLSSSHVQMVPIPGFAYANWERGFGDFHMVSLQNHAVSGGRRIGQRGVR